MKTQIDEEACKALEEYFLSCSVIITSDTEGFEHGTGVAVIFRDHHYIVTAGHVLKPEPRNEKILIVGRPDSPAMAVERRDLPSGIHGPLKVSVGTHITICERLLCKGSEDIAALRVKDFEKDLPETVFHNLSRQGEADPSEGKPVVICGFPGELALRARHRASGQTGWTLIPYCAWQKIRPLSDLPIPLDPKIDLVADFEYDETTCDPKGMSGGGVWTIPPAIEPQLWSSHQTQLLAIQSEFSKRRGLLRLVRIERVCDLLSKG